MKSVVKFPPLLVLIAMRSNRQIIRTPEGISFTQHLAGPVTRFLAFTIDLAAITVISGLLSQVLLLTAIVNSDFALAARTICYFVVTSDIPFFSSGTGAAKPWENGS